MVADANADMAGQFPILDQLVFFNHAGVAPISRAAGDALRQFAQQAETRAYIDSNWYPRVGQVKDLAAKFIGAHSRDEIAFMPNTSTGLNTVAAGLDWVEGDNVVITSVEFPANRYPWEALKSRGVELIEVPQQADGRIDVEEVCDAITRRTRVVAISHVQYASGHRIDLKPISEMVHQAGGYLCVDAIQSLGALPVHVEEMGIDFLSADGHKWLLAPEGCGLFYCREDLCEMLQPPVVGWMGMVSGLDFGRYQFKFRSDARRFEPGSYNVAGVLALGASLQLLMDVGIDRVWQRIDQLTQRLCAGLTAKGYAIFSPRTDPAERSGIIVFTPPDPAAAQRDIPPAEKIVSDLEKQGIIIVLREGRLRASPHFYNTPQQIDQLIAALP